MADDEKKKLENTGDNQPASSAETTDEIAKKDLLMKDNLSDATVTTFVMAASKTISDEFDRKLREEKSTEATTKLPTAAALFAPADQLSSVIRSHLSVARRGRTEDASMLVGGAPDVVAPKDGADKTQERKNLSEIPNWEVTRQSLLRACAAMNALPQKPPIDIEKMEAEWKEGTFGPVSRDAWSRTKAFLETTSLQLMQQLESRGLPFPPAAPMQPGKSESGTNLPETDEAFRLRVKQADKLALPLRELKPGEVPTAGEVETLVNTTVFTANAAAAWHKAFVQGRAGELDRNVSYVEQMNKDGKLDGWRMPKDATTDQLERYTGAALEWQMTVARARNYADAVASFHAATTTHGTDWPQLADFFKWRKGVSGKDTVFPDEALKAFPGTYELNPDGSLKSLKMDLPTSLERNEENMAKMRKIEAWIEKYAPQVDQVAAELNNLKDHPERALLWLEDADFKTEKKVSGEAAKKLRDANPELAVGKAVNVPNEQDWQVKAINPDGSIDLVKAAPNGELFNVKRYQYTTKKCDAQGNEKEDGDYIKVEGMTKYCWAPWHSYNNWDWTGVKTVDTKSTMAPQVFHKNDFVPIIENGRMRLMPANKLQAWAEAHQNAKTTGDVVNTAVDVGMVFTGTAEFRAGWVAARKAGSEVALRQVVKEFGKSAWHFALAGSGFGKQFIQNNVWHGHDIMEARHWLILADMGFQVAPSAMQNALTGGIFGKGKTAMEFFAESKLSKFDSAIMGVQKLYQGWDISHLGKALKWAPTLGLFTLADGYFLAQFTDTLKTLKPGEDQQPKLYEALSKKLKRNADLAPESTIGGIDPEVLKAAAKAALNDYATKFAAPEKNAKSETIDAAVKEAATKPETDKQREECVKRLNEIFKDQKASRAEKLAAANGLLQLTKPGDAEAAALKQFIAPSAVGEKLLNRTGDALFLPIDDPERAKLAADAATVLKDQSARERDRAAAAMVLLAMRTEEKPDQAIAGANATAQDAIDYLREKAFTSSDYQLRLLSGDFLDRAHRTASKAFEGAEGPLKDAHASYLRMLNFTEADMANVCMSVLKDPNATRADKIDAIAAPPGLRLAGIYNHFANELEPSLRKGQDGKRLDGFANIYGRDSVAIRNFLEGISKDQAQHPDVRALAAQALAAARGERLTANGVALTPNVPYKIGAKADVKLNGEGVQDNHATIVFGKDGKLRISDNGSKEGTWILRDGKQPPVKVGSKLEEVNANDQVIIGDPKKGAPLILANETLEAAARLNATAALGKDTPGQIYADYQKQVLAALEKPYNPSPNMPAVERSEQLIAKYKAAIAALDMGPAVTGGDAKKHAQLIADALGTCAGGPHDDVALAALNRLTPDLLQAMPPSTAQALRDRALYLVSTSPNDDAAAKLRYAVIGRMDHLFADGTPEQKSRAINALEALVIPGASADLRKQDPNGKYPLVSTRPEFRAEAIEMMAKMDPDRAAATAKLLLLGGQYNGRLITKDISAGVRAAAVSALDKAQPVDLQLTALQALRAEKDPLVLQRLWNAEYSSRRPELDPVRMARELAGLKERIGARSRPGAFDDGKAKWDEMYAQYYEPRNYRELERTKQQALNRRDPEWKRACLALLYKGTMGNAQGDGQSAASAFEDVIRKDKEMIDLLTGPLEAALTSNPRMEPFTRLLLLKAYMSLDPGKNGVVSKEELAVVLATTLQNKPPITEDKNLFRNRKADAELEREIWAHLRELKCEAIVPIIDGIAAKHPNPETRASAAAMLDEMRNSSLLARKRAEDEIKLSKTIGTPDQLAADMVTALSDKGADAQTIARALYKGILSKPLEADDPRLIALRMAMKEKNDLVRTVAATMLTQYGTAADREPAAFALADVSKNNPSAGLRKEATAALDTIKRSNAQLVERALAETANAPRADVNKDVRPDGDSTQRDVRYQRAYENVVRGLMSVPPAYSWTEKEWDAFMAKAGLPLLGGPGLGQAQNQARDAVIKNQGSLTTFLMSREEKEQLRKKGWEAYDGAKQQQWGPFNDLCALAGGGKDLDEKTKGAREALMYVILSNKPIGGDAARATNMAVDALVSICNNKGPGRGDMDRILQTLLTQKPDLSIENKLKLAGALGNLIGNDAHISRENGAAIAMLALEQSFRFGTRPDQPGYQETLTYQKTLLDIIAKHGNKELCQSLDYLSTQNVDKSVADKLAEVKRSIEKTANAGLDRLVSQMVQDVDGKQTFSAIRSPLDPRVPPLAAILNNKDVPLEQRYRAAEILLSEKNKGVPEEQRKAAAAVVATLGLTHTVPQKRYEAAMTVINEANPLFTAEQRKQAANTLLQLAYKGAEGAREKAALAVANFQGANATLALKAMLDANAPLKDFAPMYQRSPKDGEAQALLYKAAQKAQETLGKEHETTKALLELIKTDAMGPITSDKDPRYNEMLKLLESDDADTRYAMAMLMADQASTGVDVIAKEKARRVIYGQLDRLADDARELEKGGEANKEKAAAAWKALDDALARIGEKDNDYGRLYVRMKQLESKPGNQKELVDVYNKLADISEQRKSQEAATRFRHKAESLMRGTAGDGKALQKADEDFAAAKAAVEKAKSSGSATDVDAAEKALRASVEAYRTAAGPKSVKVADALTAASKFYASRGKMPEAAAAAKEAVEIFDAEAAANRPISQQQRTSALGTMAMANYGRSGGDDDYKVATTKLLAATDHRGRKTVPITDDEVLRDLVDYMISKGAINDDATRDAEQMLQRANELRATAFGKDSPKAAQGNEQTADFYMQSGRPDKASEFYKKAAATYEAAPGQAQQFGDAQAKLATSLAFTGDYRGAHAALEKGIQVMSKQNSGVPQAQVMLQVNNYINMLQQHGQLQQAQVWQKRLADYQNTGKLDTTPTTTTQTPWPPR